MSSRTRILSGISRITRLGAASLLAATAFVAVPTVAAAPAQAADGGYCSKVIINWGGRTGPTYSVPADANFNWLCRLDWGAQSVAVKTLQQGLNGHCAVSAGLTVDGIFGRNTYNALVAAQRKFGVYADGIYGPNTARAFKWTSGGGCYSMR